jgi:hypothetical protein
MGNIQVMMILAKMVYGINIGQIVDAKGKSKE